LESRLDLTRQRDVIGHVTIRFDLLVVLWNQAYIFSGFRYIQRRIWRNGWRDLKPPL